MLIRSFVVMLLIMASSDAYPKGEKSHHIKKVDTRPILEENVWAFTLESNTYRGTVYLTPMIDYSAANGWDFQVITSNIPVYGGGAQNFEYDSYFGLSKTIELPYQNKFIIGTQNGTTLFSTPRQWHNFDYTLVDYMPVPGLNFRAGSYFINRALATTANTVGYTFGVSLDFNRSLSLVGDYFSGHNNASGAVISLIYKQNKYLQGYAGVGIPETDSGNEFYGILGFILSR